MSESFLKLFEKKKPIIGVIHLPRLKASASKNIVSYAVDAIDKLMDTEIDGIIIENFGDKPFSKGNIESWKKELLIEVISEVRSIFTKPLGINILRNDALSAMDIAIATDADFIRVNYLIGVAATAEGFIEAVAHELFRIREVYRDVKYIYIMADINTKHGIQIYPNDIILCADETVNRGGADALIITGIKTGVPPEITDVFKVKCAVNVPVFIGSGLNPINIYTYLLIADGGIVGTYLHEDGNISKPISIERTHMLLSSVDKLRSLL